MQGVRQIGVILSGAVFQAERRISRGLRADRSAALALVALTLAFNAAALPGTAQTDSTTSNAKKHQTAKHSAASTSSHTATAKKHSTATGTKAHATSAKGKSSRKKSARARGQQKIDSERAQQIQQALIREHYLTGEATGTWNQASEEAMRRYQADQGWQSKTVPDSRALIKLGLGPSKDHLLNPESAMSSTVEAPKAASLTPASQSPRPASTIRTPVSNPASVPSSNQDPSGPQ